MENMNFQNVNPLNVRINAISGNLLPTSNDSQFPITLKIYSAFVWLIEVTQAIVIIPGFILVQEQALKNTTVTLVLTIEVFFMVSRIHAQRKLMNQLIQKLNDIMYFADETMKNVVIMTLKPMENPLKFYWLAGWLSVFVWSLTPFLMISDKVSFLYEDFRMPIIISKQPFSIDIFLMGNIFMLMGNMYIFVKKVGVDVYMIHVVLLITAQYRYIAIKLTTIFQDGNELNEEYQSKNQWIEREIKALCRHHNSIIHLSSMLKKLLSVNFSLIYVNSVFRFCFIGIMLSTVPSTNFLDGSSISMYACGSIVQFYILCSCVQQLLDASKEITNEAFHEKWYQFGSSVKRIFMLMILGNNLECKLSKCDKFNLSLPSFMTILNQSYSIALVLLRMK